MSIIGIIPARFASSRFPGKPLANIFGKTMIQRVYEQAKLAKKLSKVIVATDDPIIFETVKNFGGEVMMTSGDHFNGTSRCAEVASHYTDFNFVVNIQGDEPYIHPEQIDELCNLFSDNEAGLFTQAKKLIDPTAIQNPNVVKVIFDENNYAVDFKRSFSASWRIEGDIYKHIGIYGYKISVLQEIVKLSPTENEKKHHLEQLRWMDNGYKIKVGITSYESISVDLPSDIAKLKD